MRALIVDDSLVFRSAIKQALNSCGLIKEMVTASNGKVALNLMHESFFDVVIMDIEMPVMDGVETIKEIRKFNKDSIVIIFSSQTLSSAGKTITALELGANDFVKKVESSSSPEESVQQIKDELVPRIEAFYKTKIQKTSAPVTQVNSADILKKLTKPEFICIASSTGGPETLKTLFKQIADHVTTPIVMVQHMPPVFTTQLAAMLDSVSHYNIKEAAEGMQIESKCAYVAPGDFHMQVRKNELAYYIALNQQEKECFVRPAANQLMRSLNSNAKGPVLTVVLTGMGDDGKLGCIELKNSGWPVLIQSKESCVVWGMPAAVHEVNAYDFMGNIEELANVINEVG